MQSPLTTTVARRVPADMLSGLLLALTLDEEAEVTKDDDAGTLIVRRRGQPVLVALMRPSGAWTVQTYPNLFLKLTARLAIEKG